ncbi:MAG: DNA repair protein RecN [Gammaproteobacteria bacterium]|nr:DNA repair protein RecN [Gammaproteobacteria bacterium]
MLTQLTIHNFAIVRFLELDLRDGMTCVTGETGAGKSIAIDALGLCLGERADAGMLRYGSDKTEIIARFNIEKNPHAQQWLRANDLDTQDECILRRVITVEGRSRAYINGTPVPLTQLKQLGSTLINIHGQHAHQLLLKPEHQLTVLDAYANHQGLLDTTRLHYQSWRSLHAERQRLRQAQEQRQARLQLLEYQVQELDEFALQPGEFNEIEAEHTRLANSESLLNDSQFCLQLLHDGDDVTINVLMQNVLDKLEGLGEVDPRLKNVAQMLQDAQIQIEESHYELRSYLENLDIDPARFTEVENRLSKAMELARKHHVKPEELVEKHFSLRQELQALGAADERLQELAGALQQAREEYLDAATKLSASRKRYAAELSQQITDQIQQLNMPDGRLEFVFHPQETPTPTALGLDIPEIQVSTNPGQPMQGLAKIASGGELSRISLAIQVITAQRVATPTLIFDEVDVGISGGTAAIVGKMLRKLGESTQVLVVTHLPQVAGHGHQQYLVAKQNDGHQTETSMQLLDQEMRLHELARLLGGDQITSNTLANARELLISA